MKKLNKKILRLEARIQRDMQKLSKLKAKLKAPVKSNTRKSKSKLALPAKAAAAPKAKKQSTLTPQGREKLSALMKARWAAKKAVPVPSMNPSL